MMREINITYNENEIQALVQLIDIAIQASGLKNQVARNGVYLFDKIEAALKEANVELETQPEEEAAPDTE